MIARIALMVVLIGLMGPLAPWSPAARAADPGSGTAPGTERSDDPRALAEEGLALLMQALRLLVQSVPQYELPEITEDGDIIIRRRRPAAPEAPAPRKAPGDEPEKKDALTL